MKVQRVLLAATVTMAGAAQANDLTFQLNNMSGKSVIGVFATSKDESTPFQINLLAGQIAASETGELTIASQDEPVCVYDLNFQFGDGSSLNRPDVDLCQTDQLIVE